MPGTWDDPVGEPRPWGFWDAVAGAILVFGFGCLCGAIAIMYVQQQIGP